MDSDTSGNTGETEGGEQAQHANHKEQATPPESSLPAAHKPPAVDEKETASSQQGAANPEKRVCFLRSLNFWRGFGVFTELVFAGAVAWFAWAQTDVSERQREVMVEQNTIVREQLDAMKEQNKAILEQTELARGQLKVANEQIAAARFDQRAWLTVRLKTGGELIAGKPPNIEMIVKNSGRSPGTILVFGVSAKPLPAATDPAVLIRNLMANKKIDRESVIPQGGETTLGLEHSGFQDTTVASINSKQSVLYVAGVLFYGDFVSGIHGTVFCYQYSPDSKGFHAHRKYNYAR